MGIHGKPPKKRPINSICFDFRGRFSGVKIKNPLTNQGVLELRV